MDEWDAYFWPGSDVLKNIPGFRTQNELNRFDHAATRERSEELDRQPVKGNFDTAHFREIHRHLFQDIFDWAGVFRKVDFSKGSSNFAPVRTPSHTLETWGQKILGDLAAENHLKGLTTKDFVDRITYHFGEINFWHPMRDGNGRAAKTFLYQFSREAGYELEFNRVSPKTWNEASERQMSGDGRMVHEVFIKITSPCRALAFRDEHILDAVKRFPELEGAVNALYAAKRKAEAEFDVAGQRQFMAAVHAKLLDRLRAGEIINARAVSAPTRDTRGDRTRGGR